MAKAEIRNNVRRLRFDHDEMTQQELADRVGCTRQTIIALEQGKYVPSLALAFRIARAFGMPLEQVFSYVEDLGELPGVRAPASNGAGPSPHPAVRGQALTCDRLVVSKDRGFG